MNVTPEEHDHRLSLFSETDLHNNLNLLKVSIRTAQAQPRGQRGGSMVGPWLAVCLSCVVRTGRTFDDSKFQLRYVQNAVTVHNKSAPLFPGSASCALCGRAPGHPSLDGNKRYVTNGHCRNDIRCGAGTILCILTKNKVKRTNLF